MNDIDWQYEADEVYGARLTEFEPSDYDEWTGNVEKKDDTMFLERMVAVLVCMFLIVLLVNLVRMSPPELGQLPNVRPPGLGLTSHFPGGRTV